MIAPPCQHAAFRLADVPARRLSLWCLARTVRQLRKSVQRGRPLSLPDFLRLYQRNFWNAAGPEPANQPTGEQLRWLAQRYRASQPLAHCPWRLWRPQRLRHIRPEVN